MNELDIFSAALELESPEDRSRYLDEACGPDVSLRERIVTLLQSSEKADRFMESNSAPPTIEQAATERVGTSIGPYKLLQTIGEGGMGVVYAAEQKEPVNRRVALKVIKPGMDTRQVIARFEAERQALALMDHPNIAKVLDAGATDSGRPFFVMELVNGIRITDYCDEQHLSPKERLELFLPICQAVQHAHQKGIIHRDLKPSNVLVALYDSQAVPKVIDFGVAKATSQSLTDKTIFTQLGQIIGTMEYMSPEQAQRNQLDIDTRSDIYSLGVLLYELLTGTTPFEKKRLRSAAYDELLRIIREEDPPRPSARLSTIETLASVAANRRIEPQKLNTFVRGELDWIVMKALEKDRARRYETANGLSADIERFLNHEAVQACPPSTLYGVRKFVRRHRGPVTAAAALLLMLCLGLIGTSLGIFWARIAEKKAVTERDRAETLAKTNEQLAAAKTVLADSERLAREEAEQQLRVSKAMRLAAESQAVQKKFPVRGMLLAIEAIQATRQHNDPIGLTAHEALFNSVARVGGRPLIGHDEPIKSVAISPDGRWLVTGSEDKSARLWDLTADDPADTSRPLRGQEEIHLVAISPDSRWVVTAGGTRFLIDGRTTTSGETRRWDLAAKDPAASSLVLREHEYLITSLAISRDGRWLFTGSWDYTARRWDLTARDPAASSLVLRGHEYLIQAVAISPDGRWLVRGSADKTVRLWDLKVNLLIRRARRLAGRELTSGEREQYLLD